MLLSFFRYLFIFSSIRKRVHNISIVCGLLSLGNEIFFFWFFLFDSLLFVFICLFELRNCDDESMLPNNRQLHIDTMEIMFRHSQSANPDAYTKKGCKYPNVYQTIAKFVLEEKGIQIKWITNNCSSWDCLLNCHGFTVRFSVYLIQSHNSFRYVCIVARFVAAACRLWVLVLLWAINVCECLSMVMLFQSAT